jgi:hypothetical protein
MATHPGSSKIRTSATQVSHCDRFSSASDESSAMNSRGAEPSRTMACTLNIGRSRQKLAVLTPYGLRKATARNSAIEGKTLKPLRGNRFNRSTSLSSYVTKASAVDAEIMCHMS